MMYLLVDLEVGIKAGIAGDKIRLALGLPIACHLQ